MFPTISHFIKFITGLYIPLPIQTFGLFMAIAFWVSYIAFKKEFKRKEKLGIISPFLKKTITGAAPSVPLLVGCAFAGFVIGYKFVFVFQHYDQFMYDASGLIFSFNGNILGGLVVAALFFSWIYFQKKQQQLSVPIIKDNLVHPYEVTDRLLLWCAVIGFMGAILLPKLEQMGKLFNAPLQFFSSLNGMAFYGGLIFGAAIFFYKTKKMGIPLLVAADIGSPGMMLAYTTGRMGCHLSGDGDWGKVNMAPKPGWLSWAPDWVWSFNFPHNVIHQGKYIEGCTESYCSVLTQPVYPTSFYESVICLSLFIILWLNRNNIKRTGQMFFIFLLLNGTERFFMEFIKINTRYFWGHLGLSQAQIIAVVFCIAGAAGLAWLFISNKNKMLKR